MNILNVEIDYKPPKDTVEEYKRLFLQKGKKIISLFFSLFFSLLYKSKRRSLTPSARAPPRLFCSQPAAPFPQWIQIHCCKALAIHFSERERERETEEREREESFSLVKDGKLGSSTQSHKL